MLTYTIWLRSTIFLLLLVYQTMSYLSSGPHIADVNILLPPRMTHPVEYKLQGSDGCFKWSWEHHDVLSVVPEYNTSGHCSTSARLKSIAPYEGRKETAVYATDLNTGMVIRCKVYIDKIYRIQIFHSSVKLDLGGLATLRVRAFDAEDNVFSSLVGLKFMWQLLPEASGMPHNLVHVPLKDSPLSDCGGLHGDLDIQVKLEESGVFSDLFVVKGNEIGRQNVSVSLLELPLELLADEITLTVAEAMSLEPPSPVCILIGAVVHYTLNVIRNNSPHIVSLPSPFHEWSVLNSSVAQVDRSMGAVHAMNLGETTIVVEDIRVVGHKQISSLHVVLPDNLVLFISPLSHSSCHVEGVMPIPSVSRWYIIVGQLYLIHVKVFSPGQGAQEIYVTDNDEIELHDSQDHIWSILPFSEAGTVKKNYRILNAISYGLGKLTATLSFSTGHDLRKEIVRVVQEVMVCDQVKFTLEGDQNASRRVILPWAPSVYQEAELKVTGGCAISSSDYKWMSSDMAVASVSASGIVLAKKPGITTVKAVSVFDSLNYDEMDIEVSIPTSMIMLPNFPVEVPVGSHLQAAVTLQASSGSSFYACDAFRSIIEWETDGEFLTIVNTTEQVFAPDKQESAELHPLSLGPPCAWTHIYASNSGRTLVHATLTIKNHQYVHTSQERIVLKASSLIAGYSPLFVHQVSDGNHFGGYWFNWVLTEDENQLGNLEYVYLAPCTHLDVMLRGGPERWGKDVGFIENVELVDNQITNVKDSVSISQIPTSYGDLYRIKCANLGTFKFVFRRGNLMGEDHHLPAVSEVELLVFCRYPSSIVIVADEALNAPSVIQSAVLAERFPGGVRASPVTVTNGRKIRISAVAISDSGKPFANSSSLNLRWELNECEGLAQWEDSYSSLIYSTWERFLILQNASGVCTVRSTVVGFIDSLRHLESTLSSRSYDSVTDAIRLQLVSSLRVSPQLSLLFFSPESRLNVSVTGGSCFLETLINDTEIVEVIQLKATYECSQLVLVPKSLGTALVTVHDIGLVPPLSASSVVQVAEIEWIKILIREHISIEEGSFQSINFSVGVADGRLFDPSQYIYMRIRVHIQRDIVEVVDSDSFSVFEDTYVNSPTFTLKAAFVGVTTLHLSAIQHSGQEILSQPVKVEVYAPPKIYPSDLFLVPGASYVLTVRGGPIIGSHVKYTSVDEQTANIHSLSGRLLATSPGNSTLIATIYGDDDVMLCQAYGSIEVGIPLTAVLNSQSEQIAVDRTMPIYPSFSEGNLFSFYELCSNYTWTVEDENILNFLEEHYTYAKGYIIAVDSLVRQGLNFIQVLQGISPGKTKVTVSFSCNYNLPNSLSKSITYTASTSLLVASRFPLALGSSITWIFPPDYTSSDILPLFSDAYSKADSPRDKGIAYSLLTRFKWKLGEVTDDGIQIDGPKIITKGSSNLACIQAEDRSTGRTEVVSCVKVAEVSQIRIMTSNFPVYSVAIGAELDLHVKYHDDLGNPFYEARDITLFEVETNYPDVVSIETCHGHNIRLRAKSEGIALLRVSFINNPQRAVFAIIFSGPQLYPQNPVIQQGTCLNFSINGSTDSASGQWFSANQSIVSVDLLSGRAEARAAGITHVYFQSSKLKLQTTVSVLKGNVLSVDAPREILTNVPFPAKGYAFPITYSDTMNRHASLHNMLFLFECEVDPPSVGFANPWTDHETGNSYCLFFPYSPEHLARSDYNSGSSLQLVTVSIKASLKGDRNVSGSASGLFIGGFAILERGTDSFHLNLTHGSDKRFITIVGNTDVEINWHYKNRLAIKSIHRGDPSVGKSVQYEVRVLGDERFKDQLIFSLPATGQRAEIDISYNPEETKASVKPANTSLWAGVLAVFLLLILTVAVIIFHLDRPDRSRSRLAVASGSSAVAAPVTPERSVPNITNDHSPRTPQPFIDYVRRTIDETPYYRQDMRRRGNPQNTF